MQMRSFHRSHPKMPVDHGRRGKYHFTDFHGTTRDTDRLHILFAMPMPLKLQEIPGRVNRLFTIQDVTPFCLDGEDIGCPANASKRLVSPCRPAIWQGNKRRHAPMPDEAKRPNENQLKPFCFLLHCRPLARQKPHNLETTRQTG